MTQDLSTRLDALPAAVDYSDPQTYADLLGYGELANADDGANGGAQGDTGSTGQATEAPATVAAPAPDSSAPPGPAETTDSEQGAEGVATKDGKRIIPYAVLATARERERELKQANERLAAELEAARAGKAAPTETTAQADEVAFTDAELDEMEADFPGMGKLARGYKALSEQLAQAQAAAPAPQPDPAAQTVQQLIDNQPLLARWQAKGGAVWQDALAADEALKADPAWANKPMAERFAEVERRVADELGIPLPQTNTPTAGKTTQASTAPKTVTTTPTLTDLGGGPVVTGADPLAGMSRGQQVDRAMGMSLEELNRLAGIPY